MQKLIAELKTLFSFKDTTEEGDIILIAAEKPPLLIYALVLEITRDESKRDEWWHVYMQLLTIPPQKSRWTLRMPQFTGLEVFTMGGEERFVKAIDFRDWKGCGPFRKDGRGEKKKSSLRLVK